MARAGRAAQARHPPGGRPTPSSRRPTRSALASREQRIVDEQRRGRARRGRASRPRRPGHPRSAKRGIEGSRRILARPRRSSPAPGAPVRRKVGGRERPRNVELGRDDAGAPQRRRGGERRDRRRRRPCRPSRRSRASAGRASGTGGGRRAPSPAWPRRPGCGPRRAGRPDRRPTAARGGRASGRSRNRAGARQPETSAMPAASSASRSASATATLAAWCRPRSPTWVAAEAGQLDLDPVARHARRSGAGSTTVSGTVEPRGPPPDDRERLAGRAGDGEVASLDDRRLLAGDVADRRTEPVRVVEVDVRDRGDASVPGMGRVEPAPEADLDEREVDPLARRTSGRPSRSAARTRSAGRGGAARGRPRASASSTSRANVSLSIGRPPICIRSRYVTRCGFGVSPTR